MTTNKQHSLYTGGFADHPPIEVHDDSGDDPIKHTIKFSMQKPADPTTGEQRDQTQDAADNMRYAATLNLPTLMQAPRPRLGRAIIIGGAPSIKEHLEEIKKLAADPLNCVFAINWTHTWLINSGVVPQACVFFEIDAEPDSVLAATHPNVTYYICSHCCPKTFDALADRKRVLWHSHPNSEPEKVVREELFKDTDMVGGGVGTFTRTLTVAAFLGYRHFDIFGCDSSFPDKGTTHVDGYETVMNNETDGFWVWAKSLKTGNMRRFRTVGYLALQAEEFKVYCDANHSFFSCQVHGDSLLRYIHTETYPDQYDTLPT